MFRNLHSCLYTWFKNHRDRRIKFGVVVFVMVLGIILFVADYRQSAKELTEGILRNSYGEGSKAEELEVEIGGNQRHKLNIEVSERKYEEKEIDKMFEECISRIEKEMLAQNDTPDLVTTDLHLMRELKGMPVEIEWELDRYDVMNIYGEIQEEEVKKAGTLVNLKAVISYTQNPDRQKIYECMAMVYPKELTNTEAFIEGIGEAVQKEDIRTQTEKKLILPQSVDGKEIRYYKKMDVRGLVLIFMALLMGVLFYVQEIQNQGQEERKKRQQMMADYPEILNKLTLFLGAGMTLKRAFKKIVTDYEKDKRKWGIRYAYEEMKIACREMEGGVTEAESYERFGKRCDIQEYVRFGALLSQNLRKGTKGLVHILRLEALQAFENRKAMAKKFGEEAGTKLLVPMFIMFAVVLVMVIVPAFMSMQI